MRSICIAIIATISMASCRKAKYEPANYGGISFYNASYTLDTWLPLNAGSQKKILLPLAAAEQKPGPIQGNGIPFFSEDGAVNGGSRRDFPAVNGNYDVPWISFDHYSAGDYNVNVYLNSVDSSSLFSFPVTAEQDRKRTYLLSDSLGSFNVISVVHGQQLVAGKILLRLVQLCPDADSVNLRIGSRIVPGLQNMSYRSISPEVEYSLSADSTLKLRAFNAGDTLTSIGRKDLQAQPGQSYLIVLRNYRNNHEYKDRDGQSVRVTANGVVDVRKL